MKNLFRFFSILGFNFGNRKISLNKILISSDVEYFLNDINLIQVWKKNVCVFLSLSAYRMHLFKVYYLKILICNSTTHSSLLNLLTKNPIASLGMKNHDEFVFLKEGKENSSL